MSTASDGESLREKFRLLSPTMTERTRRHWAAAEALAVGRGGVTLLAEVTGLSRTTITAGLRELREGVSPDARPLEPSRCRRPGAGRPFLEVDDPTLLTDLEQLVDPATRGDPMSPLLWTCKSTRQLAEALRDKGHQVSHRTVGTLLGYLGYSLQANRKTREGSSHPDRDAQFRFSKRQVLAFQKAGQPVVAVDTKKKENLGDFKNPGAEWQPHEQPEKVRAKDFPDKQLGQAIPYGVYDLTCDRGWISVGVDHDTARFAVEAIRRWWVEMGRPTYPSATRVLLTADGGGSNGSRNRLWKVALQEWATESGLRVSVCHFPPGTSKWHKIEQRMFCPITKNWRGRPLTSRAVVVNRIAATTTASGFNIQAELDEGEYPTGTKVSDEEFDGINSKRSKFHGEWNYTILPKK